MLVDDGGDRFPIVDGIPRFAERENYAGNFGLQWNRFAQTQLDRESDGVALSRSRFFAQTRWTGDLAGERILEVGSGAGRFSRVVLEHTRAELYSVDYSEAVSANWRNNGGLAPDRFRLFQASVYDLPFADGTFDRVFCFGVLQHTPDFEASVAALLAKTRPGGELVIDFYPIRGWWTKLCAKYLLRPITTRMSHATLLSMIERNVDWLLTLQRALHSIGLGVFARFLPVCDAFGVFPQTLTPAQFREWAVLDTFDQYAPTHDHPQRVADVAAMVTRHGGRVTFAGVERFEGGWATVVRAVRA
jgi:SAM-dependent methyltransferase